MKRMTDLLALGLTLMGIFVLILALRETSWIKYIGIIGSTFVIIVEVVFYWQVKFKR